MDKEFKGTNGEWNFQIFENENFIFLVTEIGCGLAGLKPKEVAPLFKDAVNVFNIYLPSRFWHKCSNGA